MLDLNTIPRNIPLILTIVTILSNAMVGGKIKDVSDMNKLNITPSGFTFSIWGVIYSLLLYSMFMYGNVININILILYAISCILNSVWIQTWGNNMVGISSIILIFLFITLFTLLLSLKDNMILTITFMIYTTWVFIAAILNISILLKKYKIVDDMILKYGITIILTLLPIILTFNINKSIIPILLTIVWASFGIITNGDKNMIILIPIITNILLCLYKLIN